MAKQIRLTVLRTAIAGVIAFALLPAGNGYAHKSSCPQFEKMFADYGLLPVETFSYIAWRESRCNPSAINARWDKNGKMTYALNKNKTWDSGLLQINSGHRENVKRICRADLERLMVLDCNLKFAKFLLDNGGLAHWKATYP